MSDALQNNPVFMVNEIIKNISGGESFEFRYIPGMQKFVLRNAEMVVTFPGVCSALAEVDAAFIESHGEYAEFVASLKRSPWTKVMMAGARSRKQSK